MITVLSIKQLEQNKVKLASFAKSYKNKICSRGLK